MEQSALRQLVAACDRDEDIIAFVRDLLGRVGSKWSFRVMDELTSGPHRFTALMAALDPISHRVLTATLRSLAADGMVSRVSYPESPPRVEYSLTALGEGFVGSALSLVVWAQDHKREVELNRAEQGQSSAGSQP